MAAQFGRRLRKGATTTAVAAAAVAALSASQAPGVTPATTGADGGQAADTGVPPGGSATGNSPYHTDLPPLNSPNKPGTSPQLPVVTGPAEAGIPATVLAAYKQAEQGIASSDPACHLPWQLLAGIGKVESGQASGGRVDAAGTTLTPILGPILNGVGFANISDTDKGAYDQDAVHDRAVGPMQFIPSTWATWGQDANGDGRKDPNNVYDAALAAGKYLCAGGRDLSRQADVDKAILSYNHSREYLRTVMSWFEYYRRGTHQVPDGSGALPTAPVSSGSGSRTPSVAPVVPGPTSTPAPHKPSSGTPGTAKPGTTSPPTPAKPTNSAKPGGSPKPTPSTPPPPPSPTQTVSRIEEVTDTQLTADAGTDFTERLAISARNGLGKPVAEAELLFAIVGDTDSRFAGGTTAVVARTGADGVAVAPVLTAGEKTGSFTVRVTVVGRAVAGLSHTATVTPRRADVLVRNGDEELAALPGAEFADRVEVKATFKGAAAQGVAVTATMIASADDPTENTQGPYFENADGEPVRTLKELKTGADGALVLPKLFAGEQTGTFLLRLTAEGGATLTVELTVTTPAA
ncbi:lytic murein transglycosylase [Streptomyces sp. NPDC059176]|uniref:lytic murein transglycosylase n=1 Tax=Streptomyces sp. NPDC059176 TaxID=3346758 RepID=UPI0036A60603